jgi:4-alpha-glucanotransferase
MGGFRRQAEVSPEVLRRILAALGLPADSRSDLANSRRILSRRSSLADLPPLVTGIAGRPTRLDLGANETAPAQLKLERGGTRDLTLVPARGRLRVPAIGETGYHRLAIDGRELVLAIAPAQCRTIDDVVPDARLWGPAAQVYSLRSHGDGGIGDLAGVAALAASAARHGADALALSPLHAMFAADPRRYGPYSPSSRLFLNPLHAAPSLVFGEERLRRAIADAGQQTAYEQLESQNLIDWPQAAQAKLLVLRGLFDGFLAGNGQEAALAADFARFRADGGALLEEHARFEALHADRLDQPDWRRWPADLRHPDGAAVEAFANAHRRDVLFHAFLQWLTVRSLAAAQARARDAGMRIGLIADLAVGMDPTGSHAWSRQQDILLGLGIGAPPDLFNPRGQDWGLTGFSPRALADGGFAPFIATLRACMQHAGGVRIDHAMGLTRLWLVPEGADPADGAYLAYPAHDLLRLLALESVRNGAVVVGEDLGTVPAGFRETLNQAGVHGMRVLWFERDDRNGFAPPRSWEASALAMTSTHDLPTVAGWWHGTDIAARAAHGRLGDGVTLEQALAERAGERPALWQSLVNDGVAQGAPPPVETPQPVVDAAVRFVARTNSPLCVVPMEDLIGREEQPNLPGTMAEHPNWRQRLPGMAADLLETTPAAERVAALAAERPHQ